MTTGDWMETCPHCKTSYYATNGHRCTQTINNYFDQTKPNFIGEWNSMETIKEFDELEELYTEANKHNYSVYSIHFANAGVGVQYYNWNTSDASQLGYNKTEWKKNLFVNKYYPTMKEAILQETKWLKEKTNAFVKHF